MINNNEAKMESAGGFRQPADSLADTVIDIDTIRYALPLPLPDLVRDACHFGPFP
jgi:hypothetical protein